MGKQHVIARLRPNKDDDIRMALSKLPVYYDEADIVREALRQFLFSHTGREPLIKDAQVFKATPINELDKQNSLIIDDIENMNLDDSDDAEELDKKLDNFLTL